MWICYLHICVLYLQRAELLPTSCYLHLNSLYSATSDYEWPRLWMFYKTRNICSLNEQCLARWARGIATTQAPQSGSQTVPLPDGGVKEVRHTPGPFQPSIMAWKGQAGGCFCSPLPYRRSSIVSYVLVGWRRRYTPPLAPSNPWSWLSARVFRKFTIMNNERLAIVF